MHDKYKLETENINFKFQSVTFLKIIQFRIFVEGTKLKKALSNIYEISDLLSVSYNRLYK
jgi:hypothetical protein